MAYIIIRNSGTRYVSMVEKGRDDRGEVKTKAYICGLGSMSQEEFKTFQKWAHSIRNQEDRKNAVLNSGIAVTEKTESKERVTERTKPKKVKKTKEKDIKGDGHIKIERKKYVKPKVKAKEVEKATILTEKQKEKQKKNKILKEKEELERVERIKYGMKLPQRATWRKKYAIIDNQIFGIKKEIKAAETEKRIATYSSFGATKIRKIAEHDQYIDTAKEAIGILKKQKAELRR